MRIISIAVFGAVVSGCASPGVHYTCDEICANQGMVCSGQAMSAGTSSTYIPDYTGKTAGTVINGSSGSNTTYCAKDDSKQSLIESYQRSSQLKEMKAKFESDCAKWKQALNKEWKASCLERQKEIEGLELASFVK